MNPSTTLPASQLQSFVEGLFVHEGMSASHAASVARSLLWAELRGIDTHGLSRVGFYLGFMKKGVINTRAQLRVLQDTAAVQILEADASAGAVAMDMAVENAVAKAKVAGLGLVMVRATTHTGALGYFTQRMAQQGMLGLSFAASLPLMAYHGAAAAGVSTAPLSIAVPAPDGEPLVLDMASGAVSMGQLKQAKIFHTPLGAGLALDAQGQPTTDPDAATIPMPMAGPKGSGLALMFELLSSLVVMNPIIADYLSDQTGGRRHRQNAWVLALDVARFCPMEQFLADVQRTVGAIQALPTQPGIERLLMPGERGLASYTERQANGIPLSAPLAKELSELGQARGIAAPW